MTLLGRTDGQGGSYLELAEFLSTRGSARHRAGDLRQLWTRIVFNVLVSNTDDHLRNHGFILESDGWRLASAFDLNANIERSAHMLAIDTRDATPDVGLALETAPYYELRQAEAEKIPRRVRNAVRTWSERARALRLPREETELMSAAFRDA